MAEVVGVWGISTTSRCNNRYNNRCSMNPYSIILNTNDTNNNLNTKTPLSRTKTSPTTNQTISDRNRNNTKINHHNKINNTKSINHQTNRTHTTHTTHSPQTPIPTPLPSKYTT
ncbi:hypothetical protein SMACR_09319 [Sordaria macrospora]|uniref:WGS project CABT00000000 data, contig 2.84 n=2 Tax=Sordaria macrospora TaxID=5147 RepID=F7WBT4_SORMK|nr:uncharacterized protein SMAC_09319 [Sordaria macrospora k-hell]KAA8630079.1 hypothetical protein SMACR_09319 [Sordaria macrospora]CCC14477.1 unnamed protein product [Sordaria macrospora k-hell]